MTNLIELTEVTNSGDGPRPLVVNPDHVAALRPRRTIRPIDASQDVRTEIGYDGTILTLATGEQHFVTEDLDTVHNLLAPPPEATGYEMNEVEAASPAPVKKSHHKQPEEAVAPS